MPRADSRKTSSPGSEPAPDEQPGEEPSRPFWDVDRRRDQVTWYPILAGVVVGVLLTALVLFLNDPTVPEEAGTALLRALAIYFPAGFVTGRLVRHVQRRNLEEAEFIPPALHALAAGVLVALMHALLVYLTGENRAPSPAWFVAELALAAVLAAGAGLLGSALLKLRR